MLIQSNKKCRDQCGSVIHFESLCPDRVSIIVTKSSAALYFYLLLGARAHCSYLDYARVLVGISYLSIALPNISTWTLEASFSAYLVKS